MKIYFDLRTPEYLQREKKTHSFSLIRLATVTLLSVFLVTISSYLVMAFWESQVLQDEILSKQDKTATIETSRLAMTREIQNLQRQEEEYRRNLRIMQNEPATLETLDAIEMNMSTGVSLTTMRFAPFSGTSRNRRGNTTNSAATILYNATVEGSAISEGQITSLMEGLRTCGVFNNVVMQNSQRTNDGQTINFTLTLNLLPVGQIGQG